MEKSKWAIFSQHEEFSARHLDRISFGCTDSSTFSEHKVFGSEAEARKAWEGYSVSEVSIRQNISEVTEYFLVKLVLDEDGNEIDFRIEDASNISLTAWADYKNTKTGKTESVEESGFTSYSAAKEWLDEQFDKHFSEEWVELSSVIS